MRNLNDAVKAQMTELLKKEDISQADLSRKTHISRATVSKMFTTGTLSAANAVKIAKAYRVSLEFLYGLEGKESLQEYAVDTISHHLKPTVKTMRYTKKSRSVRVLSVSACLAEYLEGITEAERCGAPEDIKNEWLQRTRNSFIAQIDESDSTEHKDYALIEIKYLSDEILDEIEAAQASEAE